MIPIGLHPNPNGWENNYSRNPKGLTSNTFLKIISPIIENPMPPNTLEQQKPTQTPHTHTHIWAS